MRETFHVRIRRLRKELGLKQYEMASLLGLSRSAYGMYEYGTSVPAYGMLMSISDTLHVSVDYLMCRTDLKGGEIEKAHVPLDDVRKELERLDSLLDGCDVKYDGETLSDSQRRVASMALVAFESVLDEIVSSMRAEEKHR